MTQLRKFCMPILASNLTLTIALSLATMSLTANQANAQLTQDLYIGTFGNGDGISRIAAGTTTPVTFVPSGAGLLEPEGLAFASNGDLYICDVGLVSPGPGFMSRIAAGTTTAVPFVLTCPRNFSPIDSLVSGIV